MQFVGVLQQSTCCVMCWLYGCCDRERFGCCAGYTEVATEVVCGKHVGRISRQRTCCRVYRLKGFYDSEHLVLCAGFARITTKDVCGVQVVRVLPPRGLDVLCRFYGCYDRHVVCRLSGCYDRGRVCSGCTGVTTDMLRDVQVVWVLRHRMCCVLCRLYGCCARTRAVWCAACRGVTTENVYGVPHIAGKKVDR